MRRLAALALVLAACIGPNLISTRDDENGRGGIVTFHGRENIGYVDARVMQERTEDALDLARTWCDGGVEVNDKHSEGGENFIDFRCVVAQAAPAAKPCVEAAPAAAPAPAPAAEQAAPAAAPADEFSEPAPEPATPKKKKKRAVTAP